MLILLKHVNFERLYLLGKLKKQQNCVSTKCWGRLAMT